MGGVIMVRSSVISFLLLIQVCFLKANDGAFRAQGDHLIPMQETVISLKKEILEIKKVWGAIHVSVYYEFFNPSVAKELLVGFEAASPVGDVDARPKKGLHPYMRNFKVAVNDSIVAYNIAYLDRESYKKRGLKRTKTLKKILKDVGSGEENVNWPSFEYVYHFKVNFKEGVNIVKHTYEYDLSSSVLYLYDFPYTLTTCKRWANKQIDDFTLKLDMGEMEEFSIVKSFFNSEKEWELQGNGKLFIKKEIIEDGTETKKVMRAIIKNGTLVFKKKDFAPKGELSIYSILYRVPGEFDFKSDQLPFEFGHYEFFSEPLPKDEMSKKILRNLPFARRGMIFKDKDLQKYYTKKVDWYIPDSTYTGELNTLTKEEIKWVEKYK